MAANAAQACEVEGGKASSCIDEMSSWNNGLFQLEKYPAPWSPRGNCVGTSDSGPGLDGKCKIYVPRMIALAQAASWPARHCPRSQDVLDTVSSRPLCRFARASLPKTKDLEPHYELDPLIPAFDTVLRPLARMEQHSLKGRLVKRLNSGTGCALPKDGRKCSKSKAQCHGGSALFRLTICRDRCTSSCAIRKGPVAATFN